jgi:flagellar basal-body rod protein FlgG
MLRSLWISKTGLDAQQSNLDTVSNNLANVSTTAFKRVRPVFEDLMYQNLREPGLMSPNGDPVPLGLQAGNGSHISSTQRIHTAGAMVHSDNPLDMAISGNGFFVVDMSSIGSQNSYGYTRSGNFMRDINGYVVNANNQKVMKDGGGYIQIADGATSIQVANDGTVSYYMGNTITPISAGRIQVVNFVNPNGLASSGAGIYTQTPASGSPISGTPGQNGLGSVTQYYTEQSNVNVAEELVALIAAQRAYEITAKSVSASDQMLQKLGQL